MSRAPAALLLLLPAIACAEETVSRDYSFLASSIQMIASLAVVVGLILLTWYISGRLFRNLPGARPLASRHIRIIETRYLGPKKALILIEVAGEYLLIASTNDNISLIKQVDMLEEIEVIEEPTQAGNRFQALVARLLNK